MIQPRLTCPSVWYKRLLLSRTHVEESYSHALRRWAGYQRFLLQTDEGKSIEPFLRMLEALITDAEERADAIDNVVQAVGDSDAGVLTRIGQYESLYFKPRRDRLLKRASNLKKAHSPDKTYRHKASNQPRTESRPFSGDKEKTNNQECESASKESSSSTQPTEELKDAWIRLLQERTRYLAESLTEYAAFLNANQGNRDQEYYEKLFDACALETTREELHPLWVDDFNQHLYGILNAEEEETKNINSVSEPKQTPTKKKQPPGDPVEKGTPDPVIQGEEKELYQPRVEAHNRKWRSTDPATARKLAPINTFTVLPAIKRFGVRWSDMGTSSALMTPRSRLDMVRKYIKRCSSQKTLDCSEQEKASSVDVTDPDNREVHSKELNPTEPIQSKECITDAPETNSKHSNSESSKTNQPHISERQHLSGSLINSSGFYHITESYNKEFSFPPCRGGKKLACLKRLPKLPLGRPESMYGSKLPPIHQKGTRLSAEQQTLPVQQPCPFNSDSHLQKKKKYR